MKKLNNKGFAIASILYSIMVLFLMLLLSILGILGSRKATLDKNKKDILESLNSSYVVNKFIFEHKDITIVNTGNIDDIIYALMDGVKAIDESGNEIGKEFIKYDLNINNIENRAYNVTYTANIKDKTIVGTRLITFVPETNIKTFTYTGSSQKFVPLQNGSYKIELWGASGGDYGTILGGAGAYTKGNINLLTTNNLFVFVGGHPTDYNSGYNGGGIGGTNTSGNGVYTGGGGSTDVRLNDGTWSNFNSLKSRIMVAAGGAGSGFYHSNNIIGGSAGGLIGTSGTNSKCSSSAGDHPLATPGEQNKFGLAANGVTTSNDGAGRFGYSGISRTNDYGTGGGSGYYGGGNGGSTNCNVSAGAGGSSFISGYLGCDAIDKYSGSSNIIHTGQPVHYSGYKFDYSIMHAGNEEMPTYDGTSTMTGNNGNGYAKISLIYYY